MQVICEHPQIIINPLAIEAIAQYGNYILRGKKIVLHRSKSLLYAFKKKNISPRLLNITSNDVDTCFVDTCNAVKSVPLYLQVPCGHCVHCKNSKVNSFVDRCRLETQLYDSAPLFLTLTYNEESNKKINNCLSKRDVQLFLKRLRINLYRKGYKKRLRYCFVGEYGKRTKRAHYHAILWNLGQSDILSYQEIRAIIEKSWSNGFIMLRQIDPSNDKAFYYTSKYLRKNNDDLPDGKTKPFLVCSNRNGGIGARFIDRFRDQIAKFNTNIQYVNKWNSKPCKMQMSRYVLNRLCPSLSRSLSAPFGRSLKTVVRDFLRSVSYFRLVRHTNYYDYEKKAEVVSKFFSPYFFCPFYRVSETLSTCFRDSSEALRTLLDTEPCVDRALSRGYAFYNWAQKVQALRDAYLIKLFANVEEVNLDYRKSKILRSIGYAAEREIL